MSTNNESMTAETTVTPPSTSTPKAAASPTEEHATAKPPMLWMVIPLILIGLAIYLAR